MHAAVARLLAVPAQSFGDSLPQLFANVAHRHSLAIFHSRRGYRAEFCSGSQFCPFEFQEPLNVPFPNELFSSEFSVFQ